MGQNIEQTNEEFSGNATFIEIWKQNVKDFDISGDDGDNRLRLDTISRQVHREIDGNPDISYHGYAGSDTLEYYDDDDGDKIKFVEMKVSDVDSFEFHLTGGYDDGSLQRSQKIKSLDVWTSSVETFILSNQADIVTIHGATMGATVYTQDGNDFVVGTAHNDVFFGGDDHDYINGMGGHDVISGDEGNDTLAGSFGDDTIYGGTGDDTIYGGPGKNFLSGGIGNDTIHGGEDVDDIQGDADNDLIYGHGGNDILDGGAGADMIYGGDGNDIISSGSLKDQSESDMLWGGAGADMFIISDGSNSYTSDLVFEFPAASQNTGNDWTSILYSVGSVAGVIPGLKAPATLAKGIASAFDTYYQMTSGNNGTTTFTDQPHLSGPV